MVVVTNTGHGQVGEKGLFHQFILQEDGMDLYGDSQNRINIKERGEMEGRDKVGEEERDIEEAMVE